MTQPESMGETIPEDVLALARSVGMPPGMAGPPGWRSVIQEGIARAILAERERCAKIADDLFYPDETKISARIRDAIRKPTP